MSNPFFYLWDNSRYAGSTNLREVVDMLHSLEEKGDSPSDAVIKMAEELMPYLEAEREDCPEWFESLQFFLKRAQLNTKAVLRLEHPEVDWPKLLQIMIPLAGKNNVGMFFDADGMFVLPPGYIYPIPARFMWDKTFKKSNKTDSDLPRSIKAFSTWFGKLFHKMLNKYGTFEICDGEQSSENPSIVTRHYVRNDSHMKHDFCVDYTKDRLGYRVDIIHSIFSNDVYSILINYRFHAPDCILLFIPGAAGHTGDMDINLITSIADAEKTLNIYEEFFSPILDTIKSLNDLNEVMNNHAMPDRVTEGKCNEKKPHRLVLAKLCGDPKFNEMCNELNVKDGVYLRFHAQLWDEEWPKLVAYLKENTLVLQNS